MQMIPPQMDMEAPRLEGERLVFSLLSRMKSNGYCFHSLLQKNHSKKLISEVDFLLLTSKGILCIEVKGGIIERQNGLWYSTNKRGVKIDLKKNPFNQSETCMFAVRDLLGKKCKNILNHVNVGYAVVFPECIFCDHDSNELRTEVLLDNKNSNYDSEIDRVYSYWYNELLTKHRQMCRDLDSGEMSFLRKLFRADINAIPSVSMSVNRVEQEIVELTDEQFSILDVMDDNKRMIIHGGAGTGKTMLALEKFRCCVAGGMKVAYMCFNKNMAIYARRNLKNIPEGCFVGTFHKFLCDMASSLTTETDVDKIAESFLATGNITQLFDVIIIDEGQDLLGTNFLDVLSLMLNEGLKKGSWYIFLDRNQGIFTDDIIYSCAMKEFDELAGYAKYPLKINCRNTRQICTTTYDVSKINAGKEHKIQGPESEIIYYENDNELGKVLQQNLLRLVKQGTPFSEIVVLSKKKKENSVLKNINKIGNYDLVDVENINYIPENSFLYFTIQSFKGLEAQFVFLVDVESFSSDLDRMLNYVAMTRAKYSLYLFINTKDQRQFLDLVM